MVAKQLTSQMKQKSSESAILVEQLQNNFSIAQMISAIANI
jgi:hypothetical protein